MEELRELLISILTEELWHIVVSGPRGRGGIQKIRVRPIRGKGELMFQAALWDGKKEFHRNYTAEQMAEALTGWMNGEFRQMQADTTSQMITVLVSKKGKVTVRTRACQETRKKISLDHNRTKRYLLKEGTPVPFLVELGVMTAEGKIVHAKYDKFRQINRFLEFIEDICPVLECGRELTIIDFGCGKSYLTFAIYHYLHEIRGFDLHIIGLDLKEDVIARCNALARQFGYDRLEFLVGDIADYEGVDQVDLVVCLHACDTATDYAIAKAVAWGARAILAVPCCQHELNRQISSDVLEPVLKYGLLKERMAALVTDGLRASLLEQQGYQVQVLEFIDMEHTPKNILIRGVKEKIRAAGQEQTGNQVAAVQETVTGESAAAVQEQMRDQVVAVQETVTGDSAAVQEQMRDQVVAVQETVTGDSASASQEQMRDQAAAGQEQTGNLAAAQEMRTEEQELRECMDFLRVNPTLARLLNTAFKK